MQVVLLEDDADLRECWEDFLAAQGVGCVAVGTAEELCRREREVLGADLALLDLNLGRDAASGLDAYLWLRRRGFRGRVVFLSAHRPDDPLVRETEGLTGTHVLEKPLPEHVIDGILARPPA